MKTPVIKSVAKPVGLVAACTLVATPAFAKGSWRGTISGANSGFGSRTWVDKNSDAAANGGRITNCSRSASMAFYRNRQYPIRDEVVGVEKPTCDAYVGYKRTAGDIHFTLLKAGTTGTFSGKAAVSY
ncbi:hypothetical protein [Janibacter melonis]|uniref:hypothetical protein n=1 Tax=Janibacter melonis TaxID=262209 RepID=UPI0017859BA7|nr:hypothetical protein [Janibacter melonis]